MVRHGRPVGVTRPSVLCVGTSARGWCRRRLRQLGSDSVGLGGALSNGIFHYRLAAPMRGEDCLVEKLGRIDGTTGFAPSQGRTLTGINNNYLAMVGLDPRRTILAKTVSCHYSLRWRVMSRPLKYI